MTLGELITYAEENIGGWAPQDFMMNLPVVFEGYEGTHYSLEVRIEDGKLIISDKEDGQ